MSAGSRWALDRRHCTLTTTKGHHMHLMTNEPECGSGGQWHKWRTVWICGGPDGTIFVDDLHDTTCGRDADGCSTFSQLHLFNNTLTVNNGWPIRSPTHAQQALGAIDARIASGKRQRGRAGSKPCPPNRTMGHQRHTLDLEPTDWRILSSLGVELQLWPHERHCLGVEERGRPRVGVWVRLWPQRTRRRWRREWPAARVAEPVRLWRQLCGALQALGGRLCKGPDVQGEQCQGECLQRWVGRFCPLRSVSARTADRGRSYLPWPVTDATHRASTTPTLSNRCPTSWCRSSTSSLLLRHTHTCRQRAGMRCSSLEM